MTQRDRNMLDLFTALGDLDAKKRTSSTTQLVEILREKQQGSTEPTEDLKYALKRLVRGLSSYRDAARQGFAVTLTQVLNTFTFISVREVLTLLQESLTVPSSATGPEESNILLGQVFGILAIIRSGRLVQAGSRAATTSATTTTGKAGADLVGAIARQLLEVARKKSYLAELAYQTFIVLLSQIEKKCFEEHVLPLLLPLLKADASTWSAETLMLAIHLHELFQVNINQHNGKWSAKNGGRLLQADNVKHMLHACKHAVYVHPRLHALWDTLVPRVCGQQADRELFTAFWSTVVEGELFEATHNTQFVAYQLVERALGVVTPEQVPVVLSRAFVRRLLREAAGGQYLQAAAKHAIAAIAPAARQRGSAVSLAVLMQLAAANKQFDFFTKTRTMTELMKGLDVEDVHRFTAFLKDIFYGDNNSAATTSPAGKTAAGIESARLWALNKLHEMARARGVRKDERWFLSLLRFLFFHAFYQPAHDHSEATTKTTSTNNDATSALLRDEGLLRVVSPPLSDKTRALCAERFFVLLGDAATLPPLSRSSAARRNKNAEEETNDKNKTNKKNNNNKKNNKQRKNKDDDQEDDDDDEEGEGEGSAEAREHRRNPFFDGQCADGELWVWKVAEFQHALEANQKQHGYRFMKELSPDARRMQTRILDVARAIRRDEQKRGASAGPIERDSEAARARGFAILLLFLHTYLLRDTDVVEPLDDLLECWKRFKQDASNDKNAKKNKGSKKSSKKEDAMDEEEEEPEPMVVLVEILISFLTKASSQLRDLVTRVFRLFASRTTPAACRALLEVASGQRDAALSSLLHDEDDEDDEDEIEEDMDDDEDEDDDDEDEKDEDEDEDDDDDEEDEDEDKKKKEKNKSKSKKGDDDEEEDEEEEEELMDDEEMFQMDEKIVAVLKNMKEKKANERDSRNSIKHFKCRVIDLLEVVLRHQEQLLASEADEGHDAGASVVVEMVGPLADALWNAAQGRAQQELAGKLSAFLRRVFASKNCPTQGVERMAEPLHDVLGTLVDRMMHTKTREALPSDLFSSGVVYLLRVLVGARAQPVEADYAPGQFFDRVRAAHQEEDEARAAQRAADAKQQPNGQDKGANGKKRKRGEKDNKKDNKNNTDNNKKEGDEEQLDEAALRRRTLVRRYKKGDLPKESVLTRTMMGALDVDRACFLLRLALRDAMTRGNTHVEPRFFVSLSTQLPRVSGLLVPDYLTYATRARTVFLRQHMLTVLADLLRRPEATGEHGERVIAVLPALNQAFAAAMANARELKPNHAVALLQCVRLVADALLERARWEPARAAAELVTAGGLRERLDAVVVARRASQAIRGHALKLYETLGLSLPPELQHSGLSKQGRKHLRREEKRKRQEERERRRQEKLAAKRAAREQQQPEAADAMETEGAAQPKADAVLASNGKAVSPAKGSSKTTKSKSKKNSSGVKA